MTSFFRNLTRPPRIIIKGTVAWLVRSDPEAGLIAVCPLLRLVAWGDTEDRLRSCAEESVALLFGHLSEHGVLESFATEKGFQVEMDYPVIPTLAKAPGDPIIGIHSFMRAANPQYHYA